MSGPEPHYKGHRERLRQRFLAAGPRGLADYELLELLLTYSIPQGDVKPQAKALLARFGSLAGVLAAEPKRLCEVKGIKEKTALFLAVVQANGLRALRGEIMQREAIGSWDAVLSYCRASMAHLTGEEFRILFLDRKNRLIGDEVQQRGTVDHAPVYPREVVKRALELGATAVVLVHNHPSGDPTPSRADVDMTRQIVEAAKPLGIQVHDHLVVGRDGHASLRALGLM